MLASIAATVQALASAEATRRFPDVRLGEAIQAVSAGYTRERESLRARSTGRDALAARLAFFLPRDVVKSAELARQAHGAQVFPAQAMLRILDLGAGLGTTALGAALYARAAGLAERFEIVAVDQDARALEIARDVLTAALPSSVAVETVHGDFVAHLGKETRDFDLVVAGLALNELREDARLVAVERMLARTNAQGLVLVVEPALSEIARALMTLRDALTAGGRVHVVFPCTHAAPCPMRASARDWCHVDLPMDLPEEAARLARLASLRDERPTFAGLVLARGAHGARDAAYRVVSAPLGSKGRTELHVCGAEGLVRLRQLDRHRDAVPVDIETLRRGSLVALEAGEKGPRVASLLLP